MFECVIEALRVTEKGQLGMAATEIDSKERMVLVSKLRLSSINAPIQAHIAMCIGDPGRMGYDAIPWS